MSPHDLALFLLGTLLPSWVVAWFATGLIRRWAPALGLLDRPGQRKVHTVPTPLGGGIGIWLGVLVPFATGQLLLAVIRARGFEVPPGAWIPEFARVHLDGIWQQSLGLWVLLGGGTLLMLLGLADDRYGLPWTWRLGTEFLVATVCVVWQGWRLTAFIDVPWITWVLSVVWIAALINSFNMLDNMDGLSAGVAAITASSLAAVLLLGQDPQTQRPQLFVAGLLLVVVGALLGFLWHNRPPARIFMGDAGSYFVGFAIAVCTLLATYTGYRGETPHAVLAPLCATAVPLYDMTTVIWIRLRSGRSPFEADKNHFSHRLVELGLSKTQAVLTIYLLCATCGLAAVLMPRVDLVGAILLLLLVGCVLILIAILEGTARRTSRHA